MELLLDESETFHPQACSCHCEYALNLPLHWRTASILVPIKCYWHGELATQTCRSTVTSTAIRIGL